MRALHFVAILLTAISMSAGWAHLLELPNKMKLSHDEYLVVQQIYDGWAWLGIAVIGALAATVALAVVQRQQHIRAGHSVFAAACIALSLVVFFSVTFHVNQATQNWIMLPSNWETLRVRWEYSHAVGALLYLAALASLVAGALARRS
ncbi:MAG TPA: DUF1772 domain-containing protein [Zeimonas sp.]|nr:DUF1772 domain-containing protein [Zeimonas sp.]